MTTFTDAYLADVFKQYLANNENVADWQKMQTWRPLPPYEQEEWEYLLHLQDEQMIRVMQLADNAALVNYCVTKIKDIRTKHDKKALAVTGKVFALSEVEPDGSTISYDCMNCKATTMPQKSGEAPAKCGFCGEKEFEPNLSEAKNMQVYRLQDGSALLSIIAKEERMFYAAKPGTTVYAFGTVRHRSYYDKNARQMKFRKFIELANISSTHRDVIVTAADIDRFRLMRENPMHYQTLVESFAPHLHGLTHAKELCVLVLSSQGIARPLNGFLGGPPGTGKTRLLEYAALLSMNGHFTNVTNATLAGLTSASDRDPETDMRISKPGLFVMADNGIVCITELQALDKEKRELKTSLNDALERKEVASAKADGAYRLQARCAVLIDSNNYQGSWNYEQSLAENLKFMQPNLAAFLSRLDLIVITDRIVDEQTNRAIARANYDSYANAEEPIKQFEQDWRDAKGVLHYGFLTLQKYFAYVTSLPLPPLKKELASVFEDNYIEAVSSNRDFLVDGRYNRAIALTAKCRARLLLKTEVDKDDLQEAIRIVNKSKDIETKAADGSRDANATLGLKDAVHINMTDTFWQTFKKLLKKRKEIWRDKEQELEYVSESELYYELTWNQKWPESKARKFISNAKRNGEIIEEYGAGKFTRMYP